MKPKNRVCDSGNKLLQYSLLSAAFITCKPNSILSEVIYHDVEPDVVLDENGEQYFLNINSDEFDDFKFFNKSILFGGYWTSGSIYYIPLVLEQRINVFMRGDVYSPNAANIAGEMATIGTTFSSFHRWLPSALESGLLISEGMIFQSAYYQCMHYRNKTYIFSNYSSYGGAWYPESIDHYLGVKFKDADEIIHYGWIRCDVKDDGRTLVIKDYAYETEPDYPIVAGDTAHYVGIKSIENSIEATVYNFGKDIYILTETFQNTEVVISDLNGKQIISEVLQSKSESISMKNYPAGIYLVTLLNDGNRFGKKVFIE